MISGHGTIETAVEAIKIGAYDFIEKPFKADHLLLRIAEGAIEAARLRRENRGTAQQLGAEGDLAGPVAGDQCGPAARSSAWRRPAAACSSPVRPASARKSWRA